MSLLDDVSLMITPNGVAEDVLFGVLPQPIIGTEEITNGDFASDSNWSITNNTGTDSEITGGYLRIKTDGAYTAVSQSGVTVADKQYKLVYTVLSSDGGNLAVVTIGNIASSIPSSVGTHTYYFTSESTSLILKRRSGALDVIIDNVSVREYTSADMDFTRATTATRSAYSVEKITNGDFATDSIWTKGANTTISNGSLNFSSASSDTDQTLATINTTTYKVVFSISNYVSGSVRFRFTGTSNVNGTSRSTNGTFTQYLTATSNNSLFRFAATSFTGSIDSVSVKELLIEEVPRNLLTYSEEFTRWTQDGSIETTDNSTISPEGTQTASKLELTGSSGSTDGKIQFNISLSPVNYTFSVYAKKGNHNYIYIWMNISGGNITRWINLDDGTISGSGTATVTTTSFGDDWWKIEYTFNATNFSGIRLEVADNGATTGTGGDNIYVWGAQLETGSQATTYIYTTDRLNVPRIDYTGGGCPHILSEPQRTNLLTYSENFSDSSWTKQTGTVITANQAVAPDGNTTAYKVVSDGSNGIFESAISVDGIVARSVYLRSITGTLDVKLKDPNTTVTTKTCSLTTTWQRFELTEDNGDAANLQGIWVDDIPADGIYMWGAQLELGSYATSYIPTSGSTVTRNEDTFTRTGIADLINSTEGVLYAEIAALANDGTIRYLSINDGTGNNRVTILYYSLSNNIRAIVTSGNVTQMDKNSSVTSITDFHKVAIKWKVNDFALWIDGVEVATDTSGSAPIGLNTLSFDIAGSDNFYGKARNLQVYKTALSDTQLDDLTS